MSFFLNWGQYSCKFLVSSHHKSPSGVSNVGREIKECKLGWEHVLRDRSVVGWMYQSNKKRKLYYLILLFIVVLRPLKVESLGRILQNKRAVFLWPVHRFVFASAVLRGWPYSLKSFYAYHGISKSMISKGNYSHDWLSL